MPEQPRRRKSAFGVVITTVVTVAEAILTGVIAHQIVTPVIKTQIYFPEHDLDALHEAARKAGKSVAEMVREAVRRTWLQAPPAGPIALWDGNARPAVDHDWIYDQP
jgi:hypothetical protein